MERRVSGLRSTLATAATAAVFPLPFFPFSTRAAAAACLVSSQTPAADTRAVRSAQSPRQESREEKGNGRCTRWRTRAEGKRQESNVRETTAQEATRARQSLVSRSPPPLTPLLLLTGVLTV